MPSCCRRVEIDMRVDDVPPEVHAALRATNSAATAKWGGGHAPTGADAAPESAGGRCSRLDDRYSDAPGRPECRRRESLLDACSRLRCESLREGVEDVECRAL